MDHSRRAFATGLAVAGLFGFAQVGLAAKDDDKAKGGQGPGPGKAKGKAKHKNGKDLLGDKVKVNGRHKIDKQGPHSVEVDVKDGKIAAFHVKHDQKGDLPVKKYKTSKKMAQLDQPAGIVLVQYQYVGTTYIGYSYIDEYGYEEIYWYPYDMILDGDTGAIEYVAAY
jgi:hypothetical protein